MTRLGRFALLGVVLVTGCASPTAATSAPTAAPVTAVATTTATSEPTFAPTTEQPVDVRLKLSVTSIRGDAGSYLVNKHDGPAQQTTFTVDRNGKWSTEITVPNESMVKLDIGHIGARCQIELVRNGEVLVEDENDCIVGG